LGATFPLIPGGDCASFLLVSRLRVASLFDDEFNKLSFAMLIHIASFSIENVFAAFYLESLLKLDEFIPMILSPTN
jgi:hypothetical protein